MSPSCNTRLNIPDASVGILSNEEINSHLPRSATQGIPAFKGSNEVTWRTQKRPGISWQADPFWLSQRGVKMSWLEMMSASNSGFRKPWDEWRISITAVLVSKTNIVHEKVSSSKSVLVAHIYPKLCSFGFKEPQHRAADQTWIHWCTTSGNGIKSGEADAMVSSMVQKLLQLFHPFSITIIPLMLSTRNSRRNYGSLRTIDVALHNASPRKRSGAKTIKYNAWQLIFLAKL